MKGGQPTGLRNEQRGHSRAHALEERLQSASQPVDDIRLRHLDLEVVPARPLVAHAFEERRRGEGMRPMNSLLYLQPCFELFEGNRGLFSPGANKLPESRIGL